MNMISLVEKYICFKLKYLKEILPENQSKALLADLRKGIGKHPGSQPRIWGFLLQDMPENLTGRYGEPSYAEWAVYTTFTMYSLHQQGKDICTNDMDCKESKSLGKAMAEVVHTEEDQDRIIRRLNTLITSQDFTGMSFYLKSIIQVLRKEGISLNYIELGKDLYLLQFPDLKQKICFKWGEDFYRELTSKAERK